MTNRENRLEKLREILRSMVDSNNPKRKPMSFRKKHAGPIATDV